jgi:hypothetical protein
MLANDRIEVAFDYMQQLCSYASNAGKPMPFLINPSESPYVVFEGNNVKIFPSSATTGNKPLVAIESVYATKAESVQAAIDEIERLMDEASEEASEN